MYRISSVCVFLCAENKRKFFLISMEWSKVSWKFWMASRFAKSKSALKWAYETLVYANSPMVSLHYRKSVLFLGQQLYHSLKVWDLHLIIIDMNGQPRSGTKTWQPPHFIRELTLALAVSTDRGIFSRWMGCDSIKSYEEEAKQWVNGCAPTMWPPFNFFLAPHQTYCVTGTVSVTITLRV